MPPEHTPDDGPPPGDTDRAVLFARGLERHSKRLAALEKHIVSLAEALRTAVDAAAPGEQTGPTSWLLCDDPEQAGQGLTELCDWLQRVYLRFPGADLPACWLQHPDLVEELWWLHGAHTAAYHPTQGTWVRVGDWHDRWRPGVQRRIHAAYSSCAPTLHAAGGPWHQPTRTAPNAADTGRVAAEWAGGAR